ncbi:hypothetical protein [Halorussus litoreus]|uniref:hypothetical protein n=1 Tax=Halorussus litoreus TaxID=1710536 RepID=UPI000E28246F|nr:hypothetical protein [Halorussus litoreus]
MDSDTNSSPRWEKVGLLVGFASLAAAVVIAHRAPATGYELSIYADTPVQFWVGTGVALLVSVAVGLSDGRVTNRLALGLGGASMLAIASIPVIRSYYFFGAGDSLTHLGWVKDVASGELSVASMLYPGTHTIAVFLADVTGMAPNRALLLTVVAFTAAFLAFLPLAAWTITRDRRATALAALAGLLLLPLNNVSVFNMAHPTSQAILFLPLILYLAARYLTRADRERLLVGSPTGALLAVASVAVVLVHPQQAANVLVVFVAILGVQLLARRVDRWDADHRTFLVPTVVIAAAFLLWTPRHERASGASSALVSMLLEGPEVGSSVTQRAGSVVAVGGSVELLFAKLFLVSIVFCALAGLLALAGVLDRFEDAPDASAFARYLGVAMVPLVVLLGAFFVVSYEQLHFRQLGFIMVLAALLGAVALARGMDRLSTRTSPRTARSVVGVAVVVMLAVSVPTVYQSPYVYQSSSHVTNAQVDGYETVLDNQGSAPMIGVRGSGERMADAILGYEESRGRDPTAGSLYASESYPAFGENFTGEYVARNYGESYLTYTDRLRRQEVEVYDGLRFDRRGFRSLDATPGLNRVQANGGTQTYLINGTS